MPSQPDPNEPKRCLVCNDAKQASSGTLDTRTDVQVCDICLADGSAIEEATRLRQVATSIIRMERAHSQRRHRQVETQREELESIIADLKGEVNA